MSTPDPIRSPLDSPAWRARLATRPAPVPAPVAPVTPPPVVVQVRNVSRAWLRWTAAGCPRRTREELAAVTAYCESCAFGGDRHPVFGYRRCRKCGCSRIKLGWATEHCPAGKW